MIVPSIDLMDGHAVQLVGGRERALDAGDPRPLARRFGRVGEIAVIDLDAALGRGSNAPLVAELCRLAPCRVGGGIRSVEDARRWLDAGAVRVILGTAARPDILSALPPDRVIVAVDAVDGEVVVEGWRTPTRERVEERMRALRGLASGFLATFVEREGRMAGTDHERARVLAAAAGDARLTAAGGITTAGDVAALDREGIDAQVGMALYTGRLPLADAFAAPLRSDRPDGLWPTVVADEAGRALGLAYSSAESLRQAIDSGAGVYQSRHRGVWTKGETSGNRQALLRVEADCDRDTLRFTVRQEGPGFCHAGSTTCWGEARGLLALEGRLQRRVAQGPAGGSYTRRLLDDPALLAAKLAEEAGELSGASGSSDAAAEAADLFYFAMVALARAGVRLADVEEELDRRAGLVTRRPGEAKPNGRVL
ncbi:MAG TPA: phosphoribosyl-ATP diphosphatase [Vicinamibacterales bacterium]|nr:phosphoribosyl-ATP diphosphatase [Vicinamibacterales bacterium]